jgi:hypothetical protein
MNEPRFCFDPNDMPIPGELQSAVRPLLARPDIQPRQIQYIAALLYALKRLPKITPEVRLEVSLVKDTPKKRNRMILHIDHERFRLSIAYRRGTTRYLKGYLHYDCESGRGENVLDLIRAFGRRGKSATSKLVIRDLGTVLKLLPDDEN